MTLRLMRIADVAARTTLSKATIYRRIKVGQFPDPVAISPGRMAWRSDDIDRWIEKMPSKVDKKS